MSNAPETSAGQTGAWIRRVARGWRIVRTGIAFASLGIASLLLSLVLFPPLRLVVRDREKRQIQAQKLVHRVARAYLGWLEFLQILRVRCVREELLREPGTLIVANHPTLLDAVVLMALMPQADCVVKPRYYDHPFLGGTARGAGYVPSRDGVSLVTECAEHLVRGRSAMIFPEGTRSPRDRLGPFERGAAHIALRSGRDPVPVAITCEPPTLYRGIPWWHVPDRRFDLTLRVGAPISIKTVVGQEMSRGRAARALTAHMRNDLEERVFDARN